MRSLALPAIAALMLAVGCGGSAPSEPSTGADSAIERSQRNLISDCRADPEACGPSERIRARPHSRREALRDCIESGDPSGCAGDGEVVAVTPKLITSCLEETDATVIESFGRKAVRPRDLAASDLRELMRICHAGPL